MFTSPGEELTFLNRLLTHQQPGSGQMVCIYWISPIFTQLHAKGMENTSLGGGKRAKRKQLCYDECGGLVLGSFYSPTCTNVGFW